MIKQDQALRLVAKEILAVRKETPGISSAYLVMEISCRLRENLPTWEGYNADKPYYNNIRFLCDWIVRGEGLGYLQEIREENQSKGIPADDPYGDYVDWGSPYESRRFINSFFLGTSKHEKLKRQLVAA